MFVVVGCLSKQIVSGFWVLSVLLSSCPWKLIGCGLFLTQELGEMQDLEVTSISVLILHDSVSCRANSQSGHEPNEDLIQRYIHTEPYTSLHQKIFFSHTSTDGVNKNQAISWISFYQCPQNVMRRECINVYHTLYFQEIGEAHCAVLTIILF